MKVRCYVMDNGLRFPRTSREAFGYMEPLSRDFSFRDQGKDRGELALLAILILILIVVVFGG